MWGKRAGEVRRFEWWLTVLRKLGQQAVRWRHTTVLLLESWKLFAGDLTCSCWDKVLISDSSFLAFFFQQSKLQQQGKREIILMKQEQNVILTETNPSCLNNQMSAKGDFLNPFISGKMRVTALWEFSPVLGSSYHWCVHLRLLRGESCLDQNILIPLLAKDKV